MSEHLKNVVLRKVGLRCLGAIHRACEALTLEHRYYACVKENHLRNRDFPGELRVGRDTNRMLLSRGLSVTSALLNASAPEWLSYTADEYGVEAHFIPGPSWIEAANHFEWIDDLVDRLPHLSEFVNSLGRCTFKAFSDRMFSNETDISLNCSEYGLFFVANNNDKSDVCLAWLNKVFMPVLQGEFYRARHVSHSTASQMDRANCEAILRNWFQPRWIITPTRDRWTFSINRSLLPRECVEVHPGPMMKTIFFLQLAVLGWICVMIVTDKMPGVLEHIFDRFVLLPIDNKAYRCAVADREKEFWLEEYKSPRFIMVAQWLGHVPTPAELTRTEFACKVAYALRGKPDVPPFVGPSWMSWLKTAALIVAACWGSALLAGAILLVVLVKRKGVVTVVNNNGKIDVNEMRQEIRPVFADVNFGEGHVWLAEQRRACERAVINWVLSVTNRIRDVGGSRQRFASLGLQKHICCPPHSNDDILRDMKSAEVFENCHQFGQDCPMKHDIPFAMLSHVDYHMTQDELVRTVTGPTFVLNHDFASRPTELGVINGKAEASITYNGNQLTMTTQDGTKYSHGYHLWGNEGSIVTNSGAFSYVRLNKFYDTCLYLCYPADGVYTRDGVNVMPLQAEDAYPMIHRYTVSKNLDDGVFVFDRPGHQFQVDASVLEECAIKLASSTRDEKYKSTLLSYVTSRCKSNAIDTSNIDSIVRLVAYLSDVRAITTVFKATCINGCPVDFRRIDLIWLKMWVWIQNFGPAFLNHITGRMINSSLLRRTVPWSFPKVIVPTYEVFATRKRANFLSTPLKTFGTEKFRASPSSAHARSDKHPQCCPGEDSNERDNIFGKAGAQCRPKATAPPHEPEGEESNQHIDAEQQRPAPSGEHPGFSFHDIGADPHADKGEERFSAGPRRTTDSGKSASVPATAHAQLRSEQGASLNDTDAKTISSCCWTDDCEPVIEITTANRKCARVNVGSDVFAKLNLQTDVEADEFCHLLDFVVNAVSKVEQRDCRRDVVSWVACVSADEAILRKSGVLELPSCRVRARVYDGSGERNCGAHGFRNLDFEISGKEEKPVTVGPSDGGTARASGKRQNRKEFPKNRNQHNRHGPPKYQSEVRRVPGPFGPLHQPVGASPHAPSCTGERSGFKRPDK